MPEVKTVREQAGGRTHLAEVDFNWSPFIVFWEVTRACALACRHCRAVAQPHRHPLELTTEEGLGLIDQVAALGAPLLVLTGGDPMMRPDLYQFLRHGTQRGLKVSLAPSATRLVTPASLKAAKGAGVTRVSFSLDGSTAQVHDAFRQVPGSFQRTLEVASFAREVGLSLQINTTVSRYSLHDLEGVAERVAALGAVMWDVFFLVPTGRGKAEDVISPQEHEEVFRWLYDLSLRVPFDIKTTAGHHYRRVVLQRREESGRRPRAVGFHPGDGIARAAKGVNDGNGCLFISHVGEVCPSGFLPLVVDNVRERALAEIYRSSPVFQDLRDPEKLKGKCGRCPYKRLCGGSRARAYALTGDYLAAEPYCAYEP